MKIFALDLGKLNTIIGETLTMLISDATDHCMLLKLAKQLHSISMEC